MKRNNIKILYVDSDSLYAKKYLHFLIEKSYDVKYVNTIKSALIEYLYVKPDIVIFDENIQDGSGLTFIKKIKKYNDKFKTILLTHDSTKDILLEALSLKIDKFIEKSDHFEKLDNDIQSLNIKKREDNTNNNNPILYDLGKNFIYDNQAYQIIKNSDVIHLTNQENELISKLIKANGGYLSIDVLVNSIGTNRETTIDTLRTVVRNIRKKTYSDIIQNKSGIGYKINLSADIKVDTQQKILDNISLDCNILILKGNKNNNDNLSYQLSKFGFICESVYTIEQAKESLKYDSYNYIISELDLPDGDGIDFIRHLKDLNSSKVVILSYPTDIHYKEYLYFKGILDYIVDVDDLKYLAYSIYKTIFNIETNTKYNNILVIEPSKRISEQIKDLLLPRNYKVDILDDITKAYDIIKANNYNLILLDIEYKQSFSLITDVKYYINKAIPFVMLTPESRSYELVREAYKHEASECLRKPIFAEEFILKIDQLIEQSKLISELTEQKELMESYQQIVDKTTIVSKTDKNGIITYINEMFSKVSGYSQQELIGKPHNIIRHPDTPKNVFEDMWSTIKKDKKTWNGIIKNKTKDGNDYIVKTYIKPIFDQDDEVIEYIALRSDITDIFKNK